MGTSLANIAQLLKENNKKVQLIYAFNGIGKTRLSREFKSLVESNQSDESDTKDIEIVDKEILYYNAFTEDLFYWDNDLEFDSEPKFKIHQNIFTKWILQEQGQEINISKKFQKYTDSKLTPNFNENFTEVKFSYERGNEYSALNVKISKGEESNFVWCVFFTLIEEIFEMLDESAENIQLKYVFIDDPVTSLDDSHLIHLAVDLAQLVKKASKYGLKFVITTHNPLFYNVLHNQFQLSDNENGFNRNRDIERYRLEKFDDGTFSLVNQESDSPFSYHLYLIREIEKAIETGDLRKFHFNFLRNILEKTATFLGYRGSIDLLPKNAEGKPEPFDVRIINISSHSKHSGEEVNELSTSEKEAIERIYNHLITEYSFWKEA